MHSNRRGFVSALLALHATAASAWAQKPATVPNEEGTMIYWVVGVALAALILFPAFLNPKRSHQA